MAKGAIRMRASVDLTGKKFNKLTALYYTGRFKGENPKWLCLCDCGKQKTILSASLISGSTGSCGCLRGINNQSGSRIHRIWGNIKQRCGNKNHNKYKYYGGRGIKLCEAWGSNFNVFFDWASANGYKSNLTIDRIDNDKNYQPDNCRWVTRTTQNRNRGKRENCSSVYIGVLKHKGKWRSYITVNKETINLGTYNTEPEAAKVRDNYIINNNLKNFTMNNLEGML